MKILHHIILVTGALIFVACNESATNPNENGNGNETDTTPPTVSLTVSTSADTISNEVTLTADAMDDDAVDRVEFFVDGENIGTVNSSPFEFGWQTLTYADTMEHEIYATAFDASDNSANSDTLTRVVEPYAVSLPSDVQPIFDSRCVTCHGGSGGLFLTSGQAYSNLVNEPSGYNDLERVVPGKPDSSVLYLKVIGDDEVGDRMPQNQQPLNDLQLAQIKFWILQGAKED